MQIPVNVLSDKGPLTFINSFKNYSLPPFSSLINTVSSLYQALRPYV